MFTTGLMHLHRAGKVTNRKGVHDGHSVCTFALGTRALYDWLDEQELVRFLAIEAVNDPAVITRNRQMISVNGALAVDLAGQIAADTPAGSTPASGSRPERCLDGPDVSEPIGGGRERRERERRGGEGDRHGYRAEAGGQGRGRDHVSPRRVARFEAAEPVQNVTSADRGGMGSARPLPTQRTQRKPVSAVALAGGLLRVANGPAAVPPSL